MAWMSFPHKDSLGLGFLRGNIRKFGQTQLVQARKDEGKALKKVIQEQEFFLFFVFLLLLHRIFLNRMLTDRRLRNILQFFFPLLFVLYTVGNVLFTHSHVVDGVVIVHSHPGKTGHTHSQQGLQTIFSLTHYAASDHVVPQFLLTPLLVFLVALLPPALSAKCVADQNKANGLRAPPFCFVL